MSSTNGGRRPLPRAVEIPTSPASPGSRDDRGSGESSNGAASSASGAGSSAPMQRNEPGRGTVPQEQPQQMHQQKAGGQQPPSAERNGTAPAEGSEAPAPPAGGATVPTQGDSAKQRKAEAKAAERARKAEAKAAKQQRKAEAKAAKRDEQARKAEAEQAAREQKSQATSDEPASLDKPASRRNLFGRSKPSDPAPVASKPSDSAPGAESASAEPAQAAAASTKPAGAQPAEAKPAEAKPAGAQPATSQSATPSAVAAPPREKPPAGAGDQAAELPPPPTSRIGRVRPTGPSAPPAPRVRRARLKIANIDPWSVMKVSFLFSVAVGVILLVAVTLLWMLLDFMGFFSTVADTVDDVTGGENGFDVVAFFSLPRVLGMTTILALIDIILITALATLGAYLYNLSTDLVGGVEVTLAEEE